MTDKTIIDLDDALNRALGDAAFLKMMFDEFHQTLPEFIATIEEAVRKADMASLDRTAHQLKGASANLGVVSVSAASLTLERIGKSNKPDGAAQALETLQKAVEDFKHQLAGIDWAVLGD
ncbi:MAG: Hpt domain-containing protein [Desulfobacteraceae bacterium]|nr:Hpt domain-containing protein [Desulfobacteraceae bacterium]